MAYLYYLLSIGLIGLGTVGLYVTIFKYTKEQYKSVKFTGTGQGLDGAIFAAIMNVLPWWMVKTFLIFSSVVAVFIGVMILITM